MTEEKPNKGLTKESTMREVLTALNSGKTIEQIAKETNMRKSDVDNKVFNAGIEEREHGKFEAIPEATLEKVIGKRIYDVRKISNSKPNRKERSTINTLDQLNADIRDVMTAKKEKAKQYTPTIEVWIQVKALQKYLLNVQQDWLLDALVKRGLDSIEFTDDFNQFMKLYIEQEQKITR